MDMQTRILNRLAADTVALGSTDDPTWMTVDHSVASNVGFLHFGRESTPAALVTIMFDFQASNARFTAVTPICFASDDGRRGEVVSMRYAASPDKQAAVYNRVFGTVAAALVDYEPVR